ncbi:hypothetical protein N8J89_24660 [Crossiella sp. CA-258035]|uniref:hypothetical protein n=1 Tax=Crossiella sp. CA-258035 TaxID=2981138 RepID=UPI0024BD4D5F|nr:hypothetical protein [Crossiella sp. CA-258035]WHT16321.1 hypothetical protein N8J89_24660 [Crossiella sp. CA-258035]
MTAPALPKAPNPVLLGNFLFAGAGAWALVAMVGGFFAIPEYHFQQGKLTGDELLTRVAGLGLTVFAVGALLFALVAVLLALLSGSGRNPARILIWILGSAAVLANLGFVVFGAFSSLPWYGVLVDVTGVAILLCAGASIVLLALPASRQFYHAARQARLAEHQRWQQAQLAQQPGYWPPPPQGPYGPPEQPR